MKRLPFVMLDRAWRRVVLIIVLQKITPNKQSFFYSDVTDSDRTE